MFKTRSSFACASEAFLELTEPSAAKLWWRTPKDTRGLCKAPWPMIVDHIHFSVHLRISQVLVPAGGASSIFGVPE